MGENNLLLHGYKCVSLESQQKLRQTEAGDTLEVVTGWLVKVYEATTVFIIEEVN